MAWTPNESGYKLTQEDEKKLATLSPDEMGAFFRDLLVSRGDAQGQRYQRDIYAPDILITVENPTPQPKRLARAVLLPNGQKTYVEGTSESELDNAELKVRRDFEHGSAPAAAQSRDTQGRFQSHEDADAAAAAADARAKLVRGEITPEEYIALNPGVLDNYLRSRGIDPDASANAKTQGIWETATQRFIAAHDSNSWEGGEANSNLLKKIIYDNPELADATDPDAAFEALETAYQYAKENNLLVGNPEVQTRREILAAKSHEEIKASLLRSQGREVSTETRGFYGTDLWGR